MNSENVVSLSIILFWFGLYVDLGSVYPLIQRVDSATKQVSELREDVRELSAGVCGGIGQ